MSIIHPWNKADVTGVTTFNALTDTPSNYVGQAGKPITANPNEDGLIFTEKSSDITIPFESVDFRFLSELGLPDAQSWTLTQGGNAVISIESDNIFGVVKDSIKFTTTDDRARAEKAITAEDWVNILTFGASYSGIVRFTEDINNNLFSGMGFSPANDPRPSDTRSRFGFFMSEGGIHTHIQLEGKANISLNGTNGIPKVLINTWFRFEVVINPTPDAGVNFGSADLYVNGILIYSGNIVNPSNNEANEKVYVTSSSASGTTTFYFENFGFTAYEEVPEKLLLPEQMIKAGIKVIPPGGKREYKIIIPDGSPRAIGEKLSVLANNIGGTVTLEAENHNAPTSLFNGLHSITYKIPESRSIDFINIVDDGNVYKDIEQLTRDQINTMSTGNITYGGISEGQSNLHAIIGAQKCQFVDKTNSLTTVKDFDEQEVLVDNTLLTGETTQVIHYYRDVDGNIIQGGEPWATADQRRAYVYCGNTDIDNTYSFLTSWNNPNRSTFGGGSDLTFDILETIGGMKGKGHKITASTTGLTFDLEGGLGIRYGGNFGNLERPHTPDSPALVFGFAPFTSFVRGSKAANGLLRFGDVATELDPNNYQLLEQNDTLTVVPDGKFTIQKIYRYPGTNFVLAEYGSRHYNLREQAEANVLLEPYNLDAQLVPAMFLGFIIMKQGITDLATAVANGEAKIINHDGATKPTFLSADVTTFLDTKNIEIYENGQLESLATNGVITISDSNVFIFKNEITTDVRFNVMPGANLVIRGHGMYPIIWTGTDTFITSVLAPMHIQEITMIAVNGGTLLDLSGNIDTHVVFNFCVCIGWNMGTVYNIPTSPIAPQFYIEYSAFFDWVDGLVCTNTTDVGITDCTLLQLGGVSASTPFISMQGNVPVGLYASGTTGSMEAGESFLSIDPQVSNSSRIQISGQSLSGNYFETDGTSGTFTAVSDASIPLTSIGSISDNGGIARFNYTGATTYVNQEVVISGYVSSTSDHNGTHTITAVGTGWFEVANAYITNSSSGSFISNSITVADISTSLVNGNTLTVESNTVLNYDGGAVVYNKQPNSFQISRTFSITQAGTWNTSGLDQTDRRVIASNNPSQASSKYIGAGYMNGNSEPNTTIVNLTYTDIVLGDDAVAGAGITKASNIERWKIINPFLCILEYVGNEPFSGFIDYTLTSVSTGGAQEFRYKWVVDNGSGYADLADIKYSKNVIGTTSLNTSDKIPLSVVKGDKVKPQITRVSGASTHKTTDFSVSITAS